MQDSKRTYTKVDEFTFKIEQDRHLEETTTTTDQLNACAKFIGAMRQLVDNSKKSQDDFKKILERYNLTIDILKEADAEIGLNINIPEKVEICDDFNIIDVDVEKLPKIEEVLKK